MENWIPLTDKELKYAWKTFDQKFKFNPSISRFPGFQAPSPYITYDISAYFEDLSLLSADEDLERRHCCLFRRISPEPANICRYLIGSTNAIESHHTAHLKKMNLENGESLCSQMGITISFYRKR